MPIFLRTRLSQKKLLAWVLIPLVLVSVGALASNWGTSTNSAECCLAASSSLSSYLNPPLGEDNTFFRQTAGGDGTIVFALMNRTSMLGFPTTLYEMRISGSSNGNPDDASATGCSNATMNALNYFYPHAASLQGTYSPSMTYPNSEVTYSDPAVNTNAVKDLFYSTNYYRYLTWTATGTSTTPSSSASTACSGLSLTSAQATTCATCLTTKGYYLNPNISATSDNGVTVNTSTSAGVFSGNWLNFYPPRYVMLRTALKRMIGDPRIARFRIAVVSNSDSHGAVELEAFRPSCNGNGTPTNSFTSGIDSVDYSQTSNPIAEVLFNMGEFYAQSGRWYGGSNQLFTNSGVHKFTDQNNLCRDCDKHFVALFSDGRGDTAVPLCAASYASDGGIPTPCSVNTATACSDGTGATFIESDGDDYVSAGRSVVLGGGAPTTPSGTCAADLADDVADYLNQTDLNTSSSFSSQNTVQTYVIGVGSNSRSRMSILRAIADQGGGEFYMASNYAQLEAGLDDMLTQMVRRSTSFSGAAVSSFQVNSGATAIIPRFRPNRSPAWTGYLYRWGLFNEFVENSDKNSDGDLSDVFLTDTSGNVVAENGDGVFTTQGDGGTAATPFWEAGAQLLSLGAANRNVYTVLDTASPTSSTPDGKFTQADRVIAFTEANAAAITPYLALEGSTVCGTLSISTGLTFNTTQDCAVQIIRFVRGQDIFDEDGDLDRTETRQWVLGDLFHSSPVMVVNPVDQFLCDLGLSSQCANTLYNSSLKVGSTPLTKYTTGGATVDAYEKWRQDNSTRTRFVLVGGNDGMVHAFHAGDAISPAPVPTSANRYPETYTVGTGRELWAFIPPDLLPKLKFLLNNEGEHHYFVDGDVMVRDVWKDTSTNPNQKDNTEFHTMAVFSERRGGNHYFALDVSNPAAPVFQWLFPQPCSPENLEVGETFMTFSPKPPPIGPILLEKTGGISRVVPPATSAVATEERWAVFLQGGYDTNLNRGRGIYALDAYSGDLLFKRQYLPSGTALEQTLKYPMAAPVALIDYGTGSVGGSTADGFFDTALIADTGGQLHVMRFVTPGKDSDGDGLMDNWYVARAFEEGTSAAPKLNERNPFFFIPSATIDSISGQLRAYLGGGDRYNIRDDAAGQCKMDNPYACGKYGCTYTSTLNLKIGPTSYASSTTLSSSQMSSVTESTSTVNASVCQTISGSQSDVISACPGGINPGTVKSRTLSCTTNSGAFTCDNDVTSIDGGTLNTDSVGTFSTSGINKNRYYGVWAYGKSIQTDGGTNSREFTSDTAALSFDTARFREGNLINVTNGVASASSSDPGWLLEYPDYMERTASGAGILSSCVLWNTLEYMADGGTTACGSTGSNLARFYQANILTGKADCADSFKLTDGGYVRSVTRTVLTTPPEPIAQVSINSSGQVRYSLESFDPGLGQATTANITSSSDVMQLIYSLDVPNELHQCRHAPTTSGIEASCQ